MTALAIHASRAGSLRLPALLGLAHAVSDGAAGMLLGSLAQHMPLAQVAAWVMAYNVLAFACQPVLGYIADRTGRYKAFAVGGLLFVACGMAVAASHPQIAVVLAGVGSGAFHVGGGALTLRASGGKASGAGVFASPGVLGLAMGGALAAAGVVAFAPLVTAFVAVAVGVAATTPRGADAAVEAEADAITAAGKPSLFEHHDVIMIALLAGIALRSAVWTTLEHVMHGRVDVLLMMGAAAFAGKLAGGFLADRVGWRAWTMGALAASAVLFIVAANTTPLLLLAVALLQSATPAALAATARLLPGHPATGVGLALGLAIAVGGLPLYSGLSVALASPATYAAGALSAGLLLGWGVWQLNRVRLAGGASPPRSTG